MNIMFLLSNWLLQHFNKSAWLMNATGVNLLLHSIGLRTVLRSPPRIYYWYVTYIIFLLVFWIVEHFIKAG